MYPDTIDFSQDTLEYRIPIVFLTDVSDPIHSIEPIIGTELSQLFPEPDMPLLPLANYCVRYCADPQLIWKLSDQESKIRRQKRDRIFV